METGVYLPFSGVFHKAKKEHGDHILEIHCLYCTHFQKKWLDNRTGKIMVFLALVKKVT
jgi:hypothetical protein